MNNVEKLKKVGMLASVRQRLGARSATDNSYDEQINKASNSDLVALYSAWYLGTEDWWYDLKWKFDQLKELDQNQ